MNIESTERTIRVIPATQIAIGKVTSSITRKERVCAYARVSTDNEDQLNSYNVQCEYYDMRR